MKISQELLPLIEKAAPSIAKVLGLGSFSELAPWAIYLLTKAFGISMDQVHKLPDAMSIDPKCNDKLCQIDKSFSQIFDKDTIALTKNLNLSNIEINVKLNFDPNLGQSVSLS